MLETITAFFIQLGIGSIVGVLIGMIFQYYISKKLKIFETKLVIFRRVYKQLYIAMGKIMANEGMFPEDLFKNSGIMASRYFAESEIDIKKDLGDILFYVDGELEELIAKLIHTLYEDGAILNKADIEDMGKIMRRLKKLA
ncbi:MAG: hypothetical protein ACKKL5_00815 [Candidatus Komeilibacteria bacterium]